ncbi:MAG TPA: AbrB/MazE/SpoVT family DNA-binding domain-containing protein [Candidatus Nitrosotalea sp.]|nr:AbrB/MazE/SpoVT family DNA-binding domain-containing protein [Candidatus Nitrosotalea sp.]
MTGNETQYDPTEMFREWIHRSGKAQMDFMKTFGEMMSKSSQPTPLDVLKEMSNKTAKAQSDFVQNMANMNPGGMFNLFNPSQIFPSLASWGAFKTTVGSNGRISIPEAEREALGIMEEDLVQVIVIPVKRMKLKEEVK